MMASEKLCNQQSTNQSCYFVGRVIGVLLLCAVGWVWFESVSRFSLYGSQYTWVPAWRHFGLDFLHNFEAARYWLAGKNPYQLSCGAHGRYSYPPLVLFLFAWCGLASNFQQATYLFMMVIAGVAAWGAAYAAKSRETLGLSRCPSVLAIGLILTSFPVIFAIERGNYDLLVLAAIVATSLVMCEKPSWRADLMMGMLLALATWVKVYPALAIFGLLALKRYRAFVMATLIGFLLLAVFWSSVMQWLEVAMAVVTKSNYLSPFSHSLTTYFEVRMLTPIGLALEKSWALVMSLSVTMPFAVVLSKRVWQYEHKNKIAYLYLLWLVATATYIMPVAYDYNLFFVQLVLIAAWSKRDPWWVHLLAFGFLLTWQPFKLPLSWDALYLIKTFGWLAAWACCMQRLKPVNTQTPPTIKTEQPQASTV